MFYIEKRQTAITGTAMKSDDIHGVWFTRAIIFAVLIYTSTLYYHGSDIIAYKFLHARHYVPRDINEAIKRDVVRT